MLIPDSNVFASIGQVQRGNPIRMLPKKRVLLMDMIGHIVQQNIDSVCMGGVDEPAQEVFVPKTTIHTAGRNRPIAMVTRIHAVGFGPFPVRSFGVLDNGRDP